MALVVIRTSSDVRVPGWRSWWIRNVMSVDTLKWPTGKECGSRIFLTRTCMPIISPGRLNWQASPVRRSTFTRKYRLNTRIRRYEPGTVFLLESPKWRSWRHRDTHPIQLQLPWRILPALPRRCCCLTGDLLFVGDIGRPDLAGEDLLDQQVRNLYNSLYNTLSRFGDWVEVYPAHGAGSLCGKGMSSKPMSTLGFERKHNPLLKGMPFDAFRRIMTGGFQLRPPGFVEIVKKNRSAPDPLGSLPDVRRLSVYEVESLRKNGAALIDVRQATSFGASFIPDSLNIGSTPQSATWLGMVIQADKDIIIVSDGEVDAHAAVHQFRRVGFDRILGFLDGGISNWAISAMPLDHLPQLSVHSLDDVLRKYPDHIVLDVRTEEEWEQGHIDTAMHKPIADLVRDGVDIEDRKRHISVICGSGHRSNIAGSFLKAAGYENTYSVIGGMTAWMRMHRG